MADPVSTPESDSAAVSRLHSVVAAQRAAFLAEPHPSVEERREHLNALVGMVIANRERIQAAMTADFAVHPDLFTDLVEVLGVAGRAMFASENLEAWTAAEERFTDPAVFGTGKATVLRQPKGVVGNIVPWNFPFDLSLGPLVEMLAGGNRVVIKPSEYTPACAELLEEMISATFEPERVAVVSGGVGVAREFAAVRWDHLLYTGSPEVGREVAKAAAENLVPVTLELGGKNPAIFHGDSVDAANVSHVLQVKAIKSGQMCISVDYCLVPGPQVGEFVRLAREVAATTLAGHTASDSCTGVITGRHLDRLTALLDEARAAGCEVVELEKDAVVDRLERRLPLTLVIDPPAGLGLSREEIFGPVLVVRSYETLAGAVEHVNGGERPLALYVFAQDDAVVRTVVGTTSSGAVAVNVCAAHGAVASLGFGGVGRSGTGRHHGIDGFREFTNPRGVFVRGEGDVLDAFGPPYGELAQGIVDSVFGG
jgi:coniferyl-aldehyde dehydrogenase